ncbi:glycosyltransferase family 4 protein [Pseudomonas cichorii]|nr:glycosyltransferase family 4 protein [Pseudomonas cichorii]MBX8549040.1 glycosyltransferase family 4 protein [Pseudomonas cichorii]MBX8585001.1 glycosyltransferase family 4 protein [Pseudomonas cichorii]
MKLLIIHQNFPGQFRHIAAYARNSKDFQVLAIGRDTAPGIPEIPIIRYKPSRTSGEFTHPYLKNYENAVLHGQQVLRISKKLKSQGYQPDVILAHPGWGETLFIKDVFPDTPLIHFCEYYYHASGADCGFDPEFPSTLDGAARIRASNALHLLNLEQCDFGVTPTYWQHSLHPEVYRSKIKVIHEGVDCEEIKPDPDAFLELENGDVLRAGDSVVTYVARNLEPYRGFHSFMRAVPEVLKRHDTAKIVVVGGDSVSYGAKANNYKSWREKMLDETKVNSDRLVFTGKLRKDQYRRLLQISAVHVYLTYPFVLSWSLLESMAAGCNVVASDTAPVKEVIQHGHNGRLVDFFDVDSLSENIIDTLRCGDALVNMRKEARNTSCGYSIEKGVAKYMGLIFSCLG